MWAFDQPDDAKTVAEFAEIFARRPGRVLYVELEASLPERLRRNETDFRLAEKPSKRDLRSSRERLLGLDAAYKLNSTKEFEGRSDYLKIENTALDPGAAAERVISHFRLSTVGEAAAVTPLAPPAPPDEEVHGPSGHS